MSFILDALKKLERQKQSGGSLDEEGPTTTTQGVRRWTEERHGRPYGWGSVGVALVALILAVVALYRSQQSPAPPPSPSESPASSVRPKSSTPRPADRSKKEEESFSTKAKKAESQPATTAVPPHPSSQEPKAETPAAEVVEDTDVKAPEPSPPAHPVRLLGRNATDRAVDGAGDDEVGAPSSELPEGLPELVLQGTSVVEGEPVAVVNYQRLFVGDFIEGARVIRISDSLVELEFKGKRFRISF
jgi:hypothetical protein